MGAIIRAVAALLIISERHMVSTIIMAKITPLGRPSVIPTINSAINWLLPVVCSASLTGIIAPSRTIMGQSIF